MGPKADTRQVDVADSKYFRMCTNLEQIIPRIQSCTDNTKKFLTVVDIQRIAELLGVPKGGLDAWTKLQSEMLGAELAKPSRSRIHIVHHLGLCLS